MLGAVLGCSHDAWGPQYVKCRIAVTQARGRNAKSQVLSAGLHHLEMAQLTQTREELRSWRQRSEELAAELEQVRQNGAWLRDRLAASDAACNQLKAEAEHWRHAEKAAAANGPRCQPLW